MRREGTSHKDAAKNMVSLFLQEGYHVRKDIMEGDRLLTYEVLAGLHAHV
jgi:hypothetical protein